MENEATSRDQENGSAGSQGSAREPTEQTEPGETWRGTKVYIRTPLYPTLDRTFVVNLSL